MERSGFERDIKSKLPYKMKKHLNKVVYTEKYKFRGFRNFKITLFNVYIYTMGTMKYLSFQLQKIKIETLDKNEKFYRDNVYESNIEPIVRFYHHRKINPSGWIKLYKKDLKENKGIEKSSNCDYDYTVKWNNVHPYELNEITGIIVAGWDIEYYSDDPTKFPKQITLIMKLFKLNNF